MSMGGKPSAVQGFQLDYNIPYSASLPCVPAKCSVWRESVHSRIYTQALRLTSTRVIVVQGPLVCLVGILPGEGSFPYQSSVNTHL